ncbi:VOC family protein [candidate division KSB1 bacterium]|nr:VOC family protein [candidate division KSB1 bacterium]
MKSINKSKSFLISCWLLFVVFSVRIAAAQQNGHALVSAVEAIGMTVSDMDRALDFYTKVLTFEKVSDVEVFGEEYEHLQGVFGVRMRVVRLRLGEESIELTDYLAPEGRPIPVDSRSNDEWFQHIAIVVSDMDKAYEVLRQHKVQHASTGPQRIPDWNKGAAGIRAFYFRDPDAHNLEVIYFPAGKGDSRWQGAGDKGQGARKLFLGIDHTAIVVSNTDESLKFYRDVLGLRLAGESLNYGTEQEHLNNVFGAKLHISGLRAPQGPGLEFLEYLTPRDGREYPRDSRANDVWHWQTTLIVSDLQTASERLRSCNTNFVSTGAATLPDAQLGFQKGFLVRDPDGHVMKVVAR